MNILILCDRGSDDYDGVNLCREAQTAVERAGGEARVITLNGDEIKPCMGCFHCWVKTPGLCVMTDDRANEVAGHEMRSDAMVIISKITYGGYSYDIKSFLDRSIPNLSPFFELIHGETHHKRRYARFPYMFTIGYGDCAPGERETFVALAERNALNMRPPGHSVFTVHDAGEAVEAMRFLANIITREARS